MWYGPNLQRSYKYMMFASKMPSLRIEPSDLKCKNGCDYFGNPQWQGYCSKCHREQMQKQRRAEKASSQSATLPRPEQRRPERGLKPTTHSSFSKFEEKRLRQSETLKKANLLKFNTLFKKSHAAEEHDHQAEKRPPEFKIPAQVNDGMKEDFRRRFSRLPSSVDRDSRHFVHNFILDVIKYHSVMTVDELSERVQRQYQWFMKHMDTSPHFSNIDSETKERLIDFVEKHAMTYLHELPSMVFSPAGTDDERLDRAMSERIQQLSWVCERHLECSLQQASAQCRYMLYKAISELLGMDSALSPGGKLARVRRCCRHVLQLCGPAPASADDLLPALIFTVLKANPPRLTSNINFVTRFCNAQRLMTGEGGYYFTNLCCAVSFIENLNAESLNMDKKEFDCYMAMPASIGGSSWAAALSLCGASREADEQRGQIRQLLEQAQQVREQADLLATNADTFNEQITKKVQDMLIKTPLEILPRRELPRIGKLKDLQSAPLIDLDTDKNKPQTQENESKSTQEVPAIDAKGNTSTEAPQKLNFTPVPQIQREPSVTEDDTKLNILGFEVIERESPSKSPQMDQWELKNSLELLTPSPLGFTPFDSRSIDELMTPDDFVSEHVAPGLGNINYDLDLSDFSNDNSLAEDAPKSQDPFSPEGLKKGFDPFAPQPQASREQYTKLETFDEFSLLDPRTNKTADPFEVVHRNQDPFSPDLKQQFDPFAPNNQLKTDPITKDSTKVEFDPFAANTSQTELGGFAEDTSKNEFDPFAPTRQNKPESFAKDTSILDAGDSPTGVCLLPSPLQPQSSGKAT